MDCIFCKIINNKLPSNKVYEDDKIVAFLDIAPINKASEILVKLSDVEYSAMSLLRT